MIPDNDLDVLGLVRRALESSHQKMGALVVPTILLDRAQLAETNKQRRGAQLANYVVGWFRRNGFYGERSHVGGHGYGSHIKEIQDWYPDDITTIRSRFEHEIAELDKSSRDNLGIVIPPEMREFGRTLLEEDLVLRQVMTAEQCYACYDAIFDSFSIDDDDDGIFVDDFRERAGAPDLLVWHSDPSQELWFFCEVKSHNDHLGEAQHAWLHQSWQQIDGRFLLLILGP
jgi:hypothetical protein